MTDALLGGRYRPLGRIATGGMGEVWRAKDELLGREVAVKLLRRHVAADPAFRERFRSEARIAASLADPGIAQVFDYGEADGIAYLVMELVPGESLAGILARDGRLSVEVTLDVVQQTAGGLQAAHNSGIIHRDVKPGNLLVTEAGVIKITDFGIARVLQAAPVTQTGIMLGTAQYVSPEQASGLPLTPATDLYSLGVVAYECLAGRPPFVAETQVAIALMHLSEPPPPLPGDVPAAVRNLIMACLSKDPERRPASAREVADRANLLLETLAAGGATGLSMLTDPAGWRLEPATEWPEEIAPILAPLPGQDQGSGTGSGAGQGWGSGSGADPGSGAGPGWGSGWRSDSGPASTVGPPTRRSGLRRTTVIAAAVASCAAAVGLGAVVIHDLTERPSVNKPEEPVIRSSPVTKHPTARPTRTKPATSRPPVTPTKSHRPSVTPSATVSTSATPTIRPSTSPPPSPSPTISTPTPTTPTATPSLTPSTTPGPGDTSPSNGET
ncbi:serine/threonine-protein kinase [Streptosporangium lutulentum]|uniref:non-specific serine/threonine protein kinase n=1 Tax=Streptosporangium lutulentum TaxID=1461250 RepID=A0ABT9QPI4_9ACTN|nr:serine/threonine-protein kinase [Streptosporangium lutulentum]MDP9847824.1 serine/threonine-protein kinase [Streptosporangium lutulentum]